MIHLLFLVLFAEGAAALLLMVKVGPLRELAMRGVDQVKTGKGPATVKTLTCILKIQNKGLKLGTVSPMDQLLWRTQLLEASLIEDFEGSIRSEGAVDTKRSPVSAATIGRRSDLMAVVVNKQQAEAGHRVAASLKPWSWSSQDL